ncbi:MAG: hypothetical protein RLZZ494_2019, partial [Pseudomonadota bacterium]
MADTKPLRRVRAITEPMRPADSLPSSGTMPPAVLDTEVGTRLKDPFEPLFMGIIRTNDSVLRASGGHHSWQLYLDLMRDGKVASGMEKFISTLLRYPYQVEPVEDTPKGKASAATIQRVLDALPFNRA